MVPTQDVEDVIMPAIMGLAMAEELASQLRCRLSHLQHPIQGLAEERSASESQPVEDAVAMATMAEAVTCRSASRRPPEAMANAIVVTSASS